MELPSHRLGSQLPHHQGYLPPTIGRMIHYVLHQVYQRDPGTARGYALCRGSGVSPSMNSSRSFSRHFARMVATSGNASALNSTSHRALSSAKNPDANDDRRTLPFRLQHQPM